MIPNYSELNNVILFNVQYQSFISVKNIAKMFYLQIACLLTDFNQY